MQQNQFPFPSTVKELKKLGHDEVDIILFSGDAFIDHPSFGAAIIARLLHNAGFKVAVVPQPNWKDDLRDFKKFGKPRLFFAVTAGNLDSMINHYTANKRLRSDDAYTPGGRAGYRPDYASIEYSKILKKLFPDVPVVLGGIEASMRRFTHYDYWQDKLLPSVLINSKADLLCYGMSEKSILEIALSIERSGQIYDCFNIPQIAYIGEKDDCESTDVQLHSHEDCIKDKKLYAENFVRYESEFNKTDSDRRISQLCGINKVIANPPYPLSTSDEIDLVYDLPYTRLPHPKYRNKESIPAYEMIKDSVTIHRGCFGACSFCTIAAHQGKFITSRSRKSVLSELEQIADMPNFKGHITDLGGPSANMYKMKGINQDTCNKCKRASCIYPELCKNLDNSHKELTELYKQARNIKGIKKISIGSGLRYDLFLNSYNSKIVNENLDYITDLLKHHVSGRLKVAPEHSSDKVLKAMRKVSFNDFRKFRKLFDSINKKHNLNQQLIPYFISGHPACTEEDMAELAAETKTMGFRLEQVQTFTPTPMTLSAVMYYTGINPYSKQEVFSAKSKSEREQQQMFFFWYKKENHKTIRQILRKIKRTDLSSRLLG
jgi:uncharacterized radical SAM protein YgiQ